MNPDNNQNGQQPQHGIFMDAIQGPSPTSQPNNYSSTIQNTNQQKENQGLSPQQPYINGPSGQNNQQNVSLKPKKTNKTKFIIVAVVGVLVLVIMTAIALVATPKKKQSSEQNTGNSPQSQDPQKPADAIDVSNTNNSINQDISGLNTENDFPATQLDDKSLNL